MGVDGKGWFGGGFDGDGVGLRESGRGNEGSVVECGDNLHREIDRGHDVGHDGLERSQKVEVGIVLGLHASLELLMDGFDSGHGVFVAVRLDFHGSLYLLWH